MSSGVDILVPSWGSLPWLKLQWNCIRRFPPKVPVNYIVWDNSPTPMSEAWIKREGFASFFCNPPWSHPRSLEGLLTMSKSTIVVVMDADCIPVKAGWLDEALDALSDPKVGAAGLVNGKFEGRYRPFVHPAFFVFKRELHDLLKLTFHPLLTPEKEYFDVGSLLSMGIEDAGYLIRNLGQASASPKNLVQKTFHFCGSTKIMLGDQPAEVDLRKWAVKNHLDALSEFGLRDEFLDIIKECLPDNPLLNRYLVPDGGA